MSKKTKHEVIASIHAHFNVFREAGEVQAGPVTPDEQVRALERFVRWHERQVVIGKELLARLTMERDRVNAIGRTVHPERNEP